MTDILKKNILKEDRPSWYSSDRREEFEAKIDINKIPSIGEYIIMDYHNFLVVNGEFIDKRVWVENNYKKTGKEKLQEIVVTDHYERKLGRGSFSEDSIITVEQCEQEHFYSCKDYPNAIIIAEERENIWVRK